MNKYNDANKEKSKGWGEVFFPPLSHICNSHWVRRANFICQPPIQPYNSLPAGYSEVRDRQTTHLSYYIVNIFKNFGMCVHVRNKANTYESSLTYNEGLIFIMTIQHENLNGYTVIIG